MSDRVVEHAEAWQQHVEANRAWVAGRYRAAAEAFSAVAGQRVGLANGVVWAAAREAGSAAAAQYERDVPRPTWDGRATEVLHHVSEEEAAS
jgi:hypothetical protein